MTVEQVGAAPPEVVQYASDWPLPNRDYSNTRAATNSSIDSSNVDQLDLAWTFPINATGQFGGASSNPLILGDTVYFQDLFGNTYALDFDTGDEIWAQEYNNTNLTGPNGPAVGWDKVFVTKDPFTIAALNISNGDELWETPLIEDPPNATGEGIDIQPLVYGNLVLTSTVPGRGDVFYQGGAVGIIYALDQESGDIAWNFSTVDDPVNIWGNPEVNSGGGVWYPPAVNTETNVTYWPIANPAPFVGTPEFPNGSSRPGPNLYTNTLVALNHSDGDLSWFTQVLPHDIFDHDLQISPVLTTANINGVDQEIAISAGKMGRVYAFNQTSGALLWVAVVGEHQNDQLAGLPPGNVSVTVYPGTLGGVETPIAYADGVVYVPYIDLYTNWTSISSLSLGVEGAIAPEIQPFDEGTGGLVAIEADTGKILWDEKFDTINVGGATVVNDLVFTATFDGTIYALDRTTGEMIWNYTAPAGINAWPAVARDTIVWPAGVGEDRAVLALRLGENVTPTPTPTMNVTPNMTPVTPNVTPALDVTAPEEGANLSTGNVTVEVNVTNFTLVDNLGGENVPGEGHLHYYLDAAVPTEPGQPAVTAPGTYVPTANTSYTWENVTPGEHNLSVQLVNNDHTPLIPLVYAMVNVTVEGVAPNVTPNETPAETPTTEIPTATPTPGAATIDLVAQNLAFDTNTITVPAGAEVTVNFDNQDSGIPHNLAVYQTSAATDPIFVGGIITGVNSITYTFTAPEEPGTYFFRCDVHPLQMIGDFIVQ